MNQNMKTMKNTVVSFYQWRKTVMLVTPLDIFFILIMIGLFTATFVASFTSTKAPLALVGLKDHLLSLASRLQQFRGIDTEIERSKMESLINQVKTSCDEITISNDLKLRSALTAAYTQFCVATDNINDDAKTGWIKLKAASFGFGQPYFTGFPNEVENPVTL